MITDMNEIVALNVRRQLKLAGKKQGELVAVLKESKRSILKMLSGAQEIPLPVLTKISRFCSTPLDSFFSEPLQFSTVHEAFMGQVSSTKGKESLRIIENLSDIYLFHNQYQTTEFSSLVNKSWNE